MAQAKKNERDRLVERLKAGTAIEVLTMDSRPEDLGDLPESSLSPVKYTGEIWHISELRGDDALMSDGSVDMIFTVPLDAVVEFVGRDVFTITRPEDHMTRAYRLSPE
jgi:hypothetical protein